MGEITIHWLDVELIAEELYEAHPDIDPLSISFPELREFVEQLPMFKAQPEHPCNEKILETIQMNWINERADDV